MSYCALFSESRSVWNQKNNILAEQNTASHFTNGSFFGCKISKGLNHFKTGKNQSSFIPHQLLPHKPLLSPEIFSLQKGYSYLHQDGTSLQAAWKYKHRDWNNHGYEIHK